MTAQRAKPSLACGNGRRHFTIHFTVPARGGAPPPS